MAQPVVYRVPRRFITPPEEPPPYGLLALSFTGHVLFFFAAVAFSTFLSSRIDQSKIYIVNLVPAAPALGSPAPRAAAPPAVSQPTKALEPAPPPKPKVEERTPPKPSKVEVPPPKETPPPRPSSPVEPVTPPRKPEVARATPVPPAELALPRRVEKDAPALETPAARERLIERALPPPPPTSPPVTPPPARVPEPPRVAAPQAPPQAPQAPPTAAAGARTGVEPIRLGRPNAVLPSTGSISLDVSDFPFTYYLRQIQAKISERWAPPRAAAAGGERAIIMFEIGRDGQIKEPTLERSSGNALYDQSALRAVADASPFPPLPPEFKASSLRVHFGFEFQPDQG